MTTSGPEASTAPIRTTPSLWMRMRSNRSFVFGAVCLLIIFLMAVLAPLVTAHDPYLQDVTNRNMPPIWHLWIDGDEGASWIHLLGTDKLGRDYWSRLVYGARISLSIGLAVVVVSGLIGLVLGLAAGYFGGWIDQFITLIISTRLSVPVVLVALAVVTFYKSTFLVIITVLGLLLWDRFAVVVRAATMQVRDREYILAARAAGCSTFRIVTREVFPNIMDAVIVVATVEMANAILLEAALSFLGLGVQPPLPSWGLMLSEAKEEIFFSPWMITLPGAALFALVLSINLLGDGLRDIQGSADVS